MRIYRREAEDGDEESLVDLARSLDMLETVLSRLGRREQAASVMRETVEILKRVAEEHREIEPRLRRILQIMGEESVYG